MHLSIPLVALCVSGALALPGYKGSVSEQGGFNHLARRQVNQKAGGSLNGGSEFQEFQGTDTTGTGGQTNIVKDPLKRTNQNQVQRSKPGQNQELPVLQQNDQSGIVQEFGPSNVGPNGINNVKNGRLNTVNGARVNTVDGRRVDTKSSNARQGTDTVNPGLSQKNGRQPIDHSQGVTEETVRSTGKGKLRNQPSQVPSVPNGSTEGGSINVPSAQDQNLGGGSQQTTNGDSLPQGVFTPNQGTVEFGTPIPENNQLSPQPFNNQVGPTSGSNQRSQINPSIAPGTGNTNTLGDNTRPDFLPQPYASLDELYGDNGLQNCKCIKDVTPQAQACYAKMESSPGSLVWSQASCDRQVAVSFSSCAASCPRSQAALYKKQLASTSQFGMGS